MTPVSFMEILGVSVIQILNVSTARDDEASTVCGSGSRYDKSNFKLTNSMECVNGQVLSDFEIVKIAFYCKSLNKFVFETFNVNGILL